MDEENKPQNTGKAIAGTLMGIGLFLLELIKISLLAGVTIFLIRYYLFKPFYVKGQSMEPNFFEKEYLIIDEISYRLRAPERGEVIVFRYPENPKEYFLKRVIGLPGERVKISNNQVIIYNDQYPEGKKLEEDYLPSYVETLGDKITTLGAEQYFVLGDNRSNSLDSRRIGPIDKGYIVGRAWFRGWPVNRMQTFSAPELGL
ncbi:MAG TPA: signal peptidase I [Patescibacteria group bacterium]|nr:signal peptidase I [Patescibacteria group bacterium]